MGMYDTFVVEKNNQLNIRLAGDFSKDDDGTWQSKSLDGGLHVYHISDTGYITLPLTHIKEGDFPCAHEIVMGIYTGFINMYAEGHDGKWHDLTLTVRENQIIEVYSYTKKIWELPKPKSEYRIKAKLAAALDHGTDVSTRGKEWYAIGIYADADAFINFVEHKIQEMYPDLKEQHYISMVGVCLQYVKMGTSVLQVHKDQKDVLYVHKKRFKRHLKKAIFRSLNKQKG